MEGADLKTTNGQVSLKPVPRSDEGELVQESVIPSHLIPNVLRVSNSGQLPLAIGPLRLPEKEVCDPPFVLADANGCIRLGNLQGLLEMIESDKVARDKAWEGEHLVLDYLTDRDQILELLKSTKGCFRLPSLTTLTVQGDRIDASGIRLTKILMRRFPSLRHIVFEGHSKDIKELAEWAARYCKHMELLGVETASQLPSNFHECKQLRELTVRIGWDLAPDSIRHAIVMCPNLARVNVKLKAPDFHEQLMVSLASEPPTAKFAVSSTAHINELEGFLHLRPGVMRLALRANKALAGSWKQAHIADINMDCVEHLDLSGTSLHLWQIAELARNAPKLRKLVCGPVLSQARELDLTGCHSNAVREIMAQAYDVEVLKLRGSKITSQLLHKWIKDGKLEALRYIDVSDTGLDGVHQKTLVKVLGNLPHLRNFHLSATTRELVWELPQRWQSIDGLAERCRRNLCFQPIRRNLIHLYSHEKGAKHRVFDVDPFHCVVTAMRYATGEVRGRYIQKAIDPDVVAMLLQNSLIDSLSFHQMTAVDASDIPILRGDALKSIVATCPSMETFSLARCQGLLSSDIRSSLGESVVHLKSLDLHGCTGIDDTVFDAWKLPPLLEEIDLSCTSVSHRAVDTFKDRHPEIRIKFDSRWEQKRTGSDLSSYDLFLRNAEKLCPVSALVLANLSSTLHARVTALRSSSELEEGKTVTIDMSHLLSPEAMESFALFAREGSLSPLDEEVAIELYKFAEMFDISKIRDNVGVWYSRGLTIDNVAQRLHLARNHKVEELEGCCHRFIDVMLRPDRLSLYSQASAETQQLADACLVGEPPRIGYWLTQASGYFPVDEVDDFPDVVFVTLDGKELPADRGVLAERSLYFRHLFAGGMKESIEQEKIELHVDGAQLEEILLYLYQGALPQLAHWDFDALVCLCEASNMMMVDSLVSHCLDEIGRRAPTLPEELPGLVHWAYLHAFERLGREMLRLWLAEEKLVAIDQDQFTIPWHMLHRHPVVKQMARFPAAAHFLKQLGWIKDGNVLGYAFI